MGDKTGIAWTDMTWNPIRGCSRVSEGCKFCYAEIQAARFSGPGQPYEGVVEVRADGRPKWTGKIVEVQTHLLDPLRRRDPKLIFANSMSDFFHENVSLEWTDKMMAVMALAPHHRFQVLTKRADRMRDYLNDRDMPMRLKWAADEISEQIRAKLNDSALDDLVYRGIVPPHIWWGVSVEDQKTAEARVPELLASRAAVRFVSYEPALGPVDFRRLELEAREGHRFHIDAVGGFATAEGIRILDWIIVGGESHANRQEARPFDIHWAVDVVEATRGTETAVFVKQLGSRPYFEDRGAKAFWPITSKKADDPEEWPAQLPQLQTREYPKGSIK